MGALNPSHPHRGRSYLLQERCSENSPSIWESFTGNLRPLTPSLLHGICTDYIPTDKAHLYMKNKIIAVLAAA